MCMKSPLLSLKQITLHVPFRGTPIFKDLSLDVFSGEFVMLLGGNGSGKSSFIKMVNGLAMPTSGSVTFQDKDLLNSSISRRSKSIITLTQDLNLSTFSDLTVLENCLIALCRTKSFSFFSNAKEKRMMIKEHLTFYNVDLCDKLYTQVSSLSGGERQTLALALSLWDHPKLLLLDEHTSALDPHKAKKLMDLTHEVVREKGITTFVVTHSLNDALLYGSRLIVLNRGVITLDVKGKDKKALTRQQLLSLY